MISASRREVFGRALPPAAAPAAIAELLDAELSSCSRSSSRSKRAATTTVPIVNTIAQPTRNMPSNLDSTPLRNRIGTAIAEPTRTGSSRRMILPSTVGGEISAASPSTSAMLAAHEPITVPSAIGVCPASAVLVATASSGAAVP